jgi:hypothetical protein
MTPEGHLTQEVHTYHGFLAFMKWGAIMSFALGAIVVLLIA